MTPQEFDAIDEFDDECRYELVHGVLVVLPIPLPEETGPNELLGYYLLLYRHQHPDGAALDDTLPQQYVQTMTGRRLADRLIWTGLGRLPDPRSDVATIGVEFVSGGRRNRERDYEDKKREYREAGLKEYWIIDRFSNTMTVVVYRGRRVQERILHEDETYETALLPGFQVPLAEILQAAHRRRGRKNGRK
jgi:Uma2 family endonuclease